MKLDGLIAGARRYRSLFGVAIVSLTVVVFIRFFATHPAYWHTLRNVKPIIIIEVIVLNGLLSFVLACMYGYMHRLCGKRLSFRENFLLTAYSSIANFFGPLQSGPGVRAVYLKTKHQVSLRVYTLVALLQYAIFGLMSTAFLVGGSRPWWQAMAIFLILAIIFYVLIRYLMKRRIEKLVQFEPRALIGLVVSTFLVVLIATAYYFIELKAVDPAVSLHQAIVYSGAANLAIFVALTPDALGIRESFLVASKHLHHLSTAVILTANVIDRVAYVLYLALLLCLVLVLHVKDRLGQALTESRRAQP